MSVEFVWAEGQVILTLFIELKAFHGERRRAEVDVEVDCI